MHFTQGRVCENDSLNEIELLIKDVSSFLEDNLVAAITLKAEIRKKHNS